MSFLPTEADLVYNKLCDAMPFVQNSETFMIMYFQIKAYEKEYPSYYKTHYLISKLECRLDRLERLDALLK